MRIRMDDKQLKDKKMDEKQLALLAILLLQINKSNQDFVKMLSKYKDTRDKINHFLADLYITFAVDGVLNYSLLEHNGKLKEFQAFIQSELKGNSDYENTVLTAILINLFKKGYSSFTNKLKEIQKRSIVAETLTPDMIKKEVDFDWSGINYSSRIASNQQDIANTIWTSFIIGIHNGETMEQIANKFNKHFNTKAYEAQRLQETEVSRLIFQITDKIYAENSLNSVIYESALETNTCSECASLHGNVYNLDDPLRPLLPRHPHCLCVYLPVL
jgi:SPP1 gp7 family putative phage head morphogenesis protein